ncbi:MAG: GNAT family N-acetyltransferase [Pyrinomonadaceae bacterium]
MTGGVEIRLAVPGDEDAIADVLFEAFSQFRSNYTPEAFAVVTPPADDITGRFEEGEMWVAEHQGEIVATVSVLPEPEWLYIRSMAVSPAAQGLGIAHLLLDAIEEYAIREGIEKLFLYTTYFSISAISLYEKHGFVKVRDTTAEEWYGTPGLAMEKNLVIGNKQNVVGS